MVTTAVVRRADLAHGRAAIAASSLSRRERGGVRGYKLSMGPNPLSPTELGFTRVRSLNDVAEVGNIRLRLGKGSPAVPQSNSVLINKVCVKENRDTFRVSRLFIFVVVTLLGTPSAVAAAFPERPVTIVVPFAPG